MSADEEELEILHFGPGSAVVRLPEMKQPSLVIHSQFVERLSQLCQAASLRAKSFPPSTGLDAVHDLCAVLEKELRIYERSCLSWEARQPGMGAKRLREAAQELEAARKQLDEQDPER